MEYVDTCNLEVHVYLQYMTLYASYASSSILVYQYTSTCKCSSSCTRKLSLTFLASLCPLHFDWIAWLFYISLDKQHICCWLLHLVLFQPHVVQTSIRQLDQHLNVGNPFVLRWFGNHQQTHCTVSPRTYEMYNPCVQVACRVYNVPSEHRHYMPPK